MLQVELLGRLEGPGKETKPVVLSAAQMGGSWDFLFPTAPVQW